MTKEGSWTLNSDCIACTVVHQSFYHPKVEHKFARAWCTIRTRKRLSKRAPRVPPRQAEDLKNGYNVVSFPSSATCCPAKLLIEAITPLNAFTELCKHTLGCYGTLSKAVHFLSQEPLQILQVGGN
jgi:hypothetical protein